MRLKTYLTGTLAATVLVAASPGRLQAQDSYPSKPITMYVGFAPGSATDIVARVIGQRLSRQLGQSIVVHNMAGAASTIATEAVARAAPDGYTIMTVSGAIAIGPAIYPGLKFDVEKDLTALGTIGYLPTALLVNDALPARSFAEFVEYARQRPGRLNYGSSGVGGSTHMAAELLSQAIGVKMTHVPYKGNGPAGAAIMAGEIEVLMDTVLLASQSVKTNRVRALAVTGASRSDVLPQVPTFAEVGLPKFDASIFFGVMGPAKMPRAIVDRLNRELNDALKDPEVQSKLGTNGGLHLDGGSPEDMARLVREEVEKWKRVSREAGIKAE